MTAEARQPLVTALAGLTIACPDMATLTDLFTNVLGWVILSDGSIDPDMERAWGIAPGSAGAAFRILQSPGSDRGMVRLVSGADRNRHRPLAARWAGAEFTIGRDLDGLFEILKRHPGFETLHEPLTTDWTEFGSNIHRAFLGRVSGGTHLAFTMPLTQPKGRQFPSAAAQVGHVFDVPLISPQFDRSREFYQGTLGMIPILQSQFDGGFWHELFALPDGAHVALDILKGDAPGTGLGGIELQGYDAGLIDPETAVADRFDGGAAMVTYTTHDIAAVYAAAMSDARAIVLAAPAPLGRAPYHGAMAFSLLGPDGERLEICESLWR
jgi:catechol 2,3-dioxygenase-like lactoylglutathione lyase family enzyme